MEERLYGFIGTGSMGGALARAAAAKLGGARVLLANRTAAKAEALAVELGCRAVSAETAAESCRVLFLGVKPRDMAELAAQLKDTLARRQDRFVLVSMAAGLDLDALGALFGVEVPMVRICPNTPAAIGRGLIAWCSRGVSESERAALCDDMAGAGLWDEMPEKLMDACSVVGGCTPAYTYMFIEALADGAVRCGMPRQKALLYAAQAVEGAAALALATGRHPGELKDAVCSPGGSTIVGVNTLEEHGFRAAAMDAVCAAVARTAEMNR